MNKGKSSIKINKAKLKNKKIALIKANFNADITDKMLSEAVNILKKYKVKYDIYEVPGSFEIPYKIKQISADYNGFVAIGCLIKGETLHFEYVASAVSQGLMNLAIDLTKPIGFAILTCLNKSQAQARVKNIEQAVKSVLNLI